MSVYFLKRTLQNISPDFSPFAYSIVACRGCVTVAQGLHVTSDYELISDYYNYINFCCQSWRHEKHFVDHSLNDLALFHQCQSVITISMHINVNRS